MRYRAPSARSILVNAEPTNPRAVRRRRRAGDRDWRARNGPDSHDTIAVNVKIALYRFLLVLLVPPLAYAALDPGFSASQVIPHAQLRGMGVPYSALLFFENHFGGIVHFVTAFVLTLLLPAARLLGSTPLRTQRSFTIGVLLAAALLVETIQYLTGRGFDAGDLLSHLLGMASGVAAWRLAAVT